MKQESVHRELEFLLQNLSRPSIFYIPHALFPSLELEHVRQLDDMGCFNTIGFIGKDGEIGTKLPFVDKLLLTKKKQTLSGNYLQLLELNGRLNKEAFNLLLETYLADANSWHYAYTWLEEHVEREMPKIASNQKQMFSYQRQVLEAHIEEVNKRFALAQKHDVDLRRVLSKYEQKFPLDKSTIETLTETVKLDIQNNRRNKAQAKKPMLSEGEVDYFLLKTVFNVNFDKISNN